MGGQLRSKTFTQALTAAALAESFSIGTGRRCIITQVLFHSSVLITETFSLTHDSKEGANYDTLLVSTDLVAAQDYVFRPEGEVCLESGDALSIGCTDANSLGIVYVTVKYKEVL